MEFADWLARDEPARHVALDAFDKFLDILNPPYELRIRLRQLLEFQPEVRPTSADIVEDGTNPRAASSRIPSSGREG